MSTKRLAGLLVDIVRLRQRIAQLKRENGAYIDIDAVRVKLNHACARLADV